MWHEVIDLVKFKENYTNRRLNMDIIMKSKVLEVVKINGKTQAKLFKDLKIGDKIQLSIPVDYAGFNRGTYASYITVENIVTGNKTYKSFNLLPTLLNNFDFVEC